MIDKKLFLPGRANSCYLLSAAQTCLGLEKHPGLQGETGEVVFAQAVPGLENESRFSDTHAQTWLAKACYLSLLLKQV